MNHYNDYELLYMINEFDEEAESILYSKYKNLINKRMSDFKIRVDRREDFMQEGLFVLSNAIRSYNEYCNKTFNKYFDLLLQRRFINILRNEKMYFYNVVLREDDSFIYESNTFTYNEYDYFKVNGLSEFEKEVLKLKNRNYRPKEIAIKLQCDIKSIYNCLCRIKTKIKND